MQKLLIRFVMCLFLLAVLLLNHGLIILTSDSAVLSTDNEDMLDGLTFNNNSTHVILGMWDFLGFRTPAQLFKAKTQRHRQTLNGGGLKRFCQTLRKTGSRAEVIIFLGVGGEESANSNRVTQDVRDMLSDFSIKVIPFEKGVISRLNLYTFSSLRFTLYNKFLAKYGHLFRYIMTTDVSDVIFQLDPFLSMFPSQQKVNSVIIAALERAENIMTEDGINGYWVQKCYGSGVLKSLLGVRVSCSGTTLGDSVSMSLYVEEMERVMRTSVLCAVQGMDQGVHNVILRKVPALSSRVRYEAEEDGSIITLDRVSRLHFEAETGRILNWKGQPYAIVHQIDRCFEFTTHFVEGPSPSEKSIADKYNCSTLSNPPDTWFSS